MQLARRRPGTDVVVEDVAGGRAVYAGAGSPLTEAKAIGLHGPVTDADLDRMEAVFFDEVKRLGSSSVPWPTHRWSRGWAAGAIGLSHFENILVLPLQRDDPEPPPPPGIEVRPVEPDEADLYARVVAPNFAGPGEAIEAGLEMIATMFGMAHALSFLARIDGEAVGGGSVLIERGLALLAGAATLAPYRNRGVHAALHHARLALARRAGCDLAAQGRSPAAPRSATPSGAASGSPTPVRSSSASRSDRDRDASGVVVDHR